MQKVVPRLSEDGDVTETQQIVCAMFTSKLPWEGPHKFLYRGPQIAKTTTARSITVPTKKSAFNSYMRYNASHRNLKYIFEYLLPCYCYATKANSRTIRSQVSQPAAAGREANLVNFKLITAWHQNSEPDSFVVEVSYRQTNCHCKN